MTTPYPIPEGWYQVYDGLVNVGDQLWAERSHMPRFILVTEEVLNHLGFLDAMAVEECVCVIRRL